MSRKTILFVALVLLLLAGPLLWILTRDAAAPPVPAPVAPAANSPPLVAPKMSARAAAAAAKKEAEAPPAAKAVARAPTARVSTVVRVTLEGTDVAPPADTYVKLRMVPNPSLRAGPLPDPIEIHEGPDAVFDIDATDLFTGFVPEEEIEVAADRGGFLPARVRQRVSQLRSVNGKPAVVPVAVDLVLAGEATGIVQDERNRPVAHAEIGSFIVAGGKLTFVDDTATDDEGRFRVRLCPGAVHVVVAVAKGLMPSSAQVLGVAGEAAPVTGLVLYEGYAVGGHVHVAVRGGPPPGLQVLAFPTQEGESFQLGDEWYSYRSGLVLRRPGTAAVLADGTYRVTGLAPEEHVLSLDCPEMLTEVADTTAVRATPPADGVDLGLSAAWSTVKVRGPHGPIAQAAVTLRVLPTDADAERRIPWLDERTPPSASGETDEHGIVWFLAPEGRRYWLRVSADGYEQARRGATPPFSESFDLRERPETELDLKLEPSPEPDGPGPVPARIELRFFDVSDPRPFPAAICRAELGDGGMYVVRGLSNVNVYTTFHVEIAAKPAGWYLPTTVDVKLSYAKVTGATAKIVRGGRVHVEIRGPSGAPMSGTYSVEDTAGLEHAAGTVSANGRDSADALVPPGAYRVVVTPADGAAQTVPVTVEVAKTVRVTVTAGAAR